MVAIFFTHPATSASFLIYLRLRRTVEFKFSANAGAAHAEVFEGASEAGLLMALEMVH